MKPTKFQMDILSNNVHGVATTLSGSPSLVHQPFTSISYVQTPLHVAANIGSLDMCILLLSYSANVSARDSGGLTPLQSACFGVRKVHYGDHVRVCEELLSRGAALNTRDNDGDTPLHSAVEANSAPLVKLFLAHGAQCDVVNSMRLTAPLFAEVLCRTEICEIFSSQGYSVASDQEIAEGTFHYLYDGAKRSEAAGDYAHAFTVIEKAFQVFPEQPALIGLRALVYEKTGKLDLAKQDYEWAYNLDPTSTVRLLNHATMLEEDYFRDYAGAEKLYLETITLDPTHASAMSALGDLYETMENLPKAKEMYERALAVNPKNSLAFRNLTRLKFMSAMRGRDVPTIDRLIEGLRTLKSTGDSFTDNEVQLNIQGMLKNRDLVVQGVVLFPCEKCGTHANLKCSRCNFSRYCGRDCQVAHWKTHKAVCGKASSTRPPNRKHFGKWGCPDCGVPCTCGVSPHLSTCSHAFYNNTDSGTVCPGAAPCIWLHCCESTEKVGLCNRDLKTAKHSNRLLKYQLCNRPAL